MWEGPRHVCGHASAGNSWGRVKVKAATSSLICNNKHACLLLQINDDAWASPASTDHEALPTLGSWRSVT